MNRPLTLRAGPPLAPRLGSAAAFAFLVALLAPAPAVTLEVDKYRKREPSSLSRESGAVYLEDLFDDPVHLEVLKPAPIFYTLEGKRRLGTLLDKQKVELEAISDRAYRVRGRAEHGDVVGWVGTAFIKPPSDTFEEDIRKLYERQQEVEKLIAEGEIALGMTVAEVIASIGDPQEQQSATDADGVRETLAWITYTRVPRKTLSRDAYGRLFTTTVYVRVETGRLSVEFEDGIAARIEEKERDPNRARTRIVPAPIILRY